MNEDTRACSPRAGAAVGSASPMAPVLMLQEYSDAEAAESEAANPREAIQAVLIHRANGLAHCGLPYCPRAD
jgi:hypothetical protein